MNNRLEFSIPTSNESEQHELFANFRAHGFGALQLKGGQYARYLGEPQQFVADWGEALGAHSSLICGGGLDESGAANLRQIFDFAAQIGSERVVFCHGRSREGVTSDDLRHCAQTLSDLGAKAQTRGVKLSLHHHFDNPVMHREDFEIFFAAATPGTLGLTLDTAHAHKSGISDIAGLVRDFGSFLDNVHLKDFARGDWQTLGKGEIDFAPIISALREIDYCGPLCADEESGASVQSALQDAAQWLQRV